MKEQLVHILDQSVCLSRKQMKEYLSGTMLSEEMHAAEVHLNSCALCSLAMEGFEEHSEEALQAIASLNSGFLKEHFDNITPKIHLNSVAHVIMPTAESRKRITLAPLWRVGSVAAAALLIFGIIWAFDRRSSMGLRQERQIAVNESGTAPKHGGHGAVTGSADAARTTSSEDLAASREGSPLTPSAPVAVAVNKQPKAEQSENSAPQLAEVSPSVIGAAVRQQSVVDGARAAGTAATKPNATSPDAASGSGAGRDITIVSEYRPANDAVQSEDSRNESAREQASNADVAPLKSAPASPRTKSTSSASASSVPAAHSDEAGDKSYGKGSHQAALANHLKGTKSSDEHVRYNSMLMAAKEYVALGNKEKAEELLKRIIDNGSGRIRREARRELKRLK